MRMIPVSLQNMIIMECREHPKTITQL
jgi:hypothetical protein